MQASAGETGARDTQSNPFYITNNGGYGTAWASTGGENPVKAEQTPLYSEIVSQWCDTTARTGI